MKRTKTININGLEITLQSVSPQWYLEMCDKFGITGGHRDSRAYADTMIKNMVVSPHELRVEGIAYFDKNEDSGRLLKLNSEIERFLLEPADISPIKGEGTSA